MLLCLLTAGCASSNKLSEAAASSEAPIDWTGTLTPRNESSVRGTIELKSALVGGTANVSITGATAGSQHPWHVHTGTCANSGAIVGSPPSYPVLSVGSDGRASATATIGAALTPGTPYIVNVHRSTSDMGTIIACGELKI
jgi:hypothetical protein